MVKTPTRVWLWLLFEAQEKGILQVRQRIRSEGENKIRRKKCARWDLLQLLLQQCKCSCRENSVVLLPARCLRMKVKQACRQGDINRSNADRQTDRHTQSDKQTHTQSDRPVTAGQKLKGHQRLKLCNHCASPVPSNRTTRKKQATSVGNSQG